MSNGAKIMITIENSGLFIIDVQGTLAEQMHESSALLKNLSILIQGAKLLDIPIVWVEQLPDKLGSTHKVLKNFSFCLIFLSSLFQNLLSVLGEIMKCARK